MHDGNFISHMVCGHLHFYENKIVISKAKKKKNSIQINRNFLLNEVKYLKSIINTHNMIKIVLLWYKLLRPVRRCKVIDENFLKLKKTI